MSFKFKVTHRFERSVKKLKRRYPKITKDLAKAFEQIEENPETGVVIPNDYSIRKVRVASTDMKRGKGGGFRLLYKLSSVDNEDDSLSASILFVYAKTNQSNVSETFLELLDEDVGDEVDE